MVRPIGGGHRDVTATQPGNASNAASNNRFSYPASRAVSNPNPHARWSGTQVSQGSYIRGATERQQPIASQVASASVPNTGRRSSLLFTPPSGNQDASTQAQRGETIQSADSSEQLPLPSGEVAPRQSLNEILLSRLNEGRDENFRLPIVEGAIYGLHHRFELLNDVKSQNMTDISLLGEVGGILSTAVSLLETGWQELRRPEDPVLIVAYEQQQQQLQAFGPQLLSEINNAAAGLVESLKKSEVDVAQGSANAIGPRDKKLQKLHKRRERFKAEFPKKLIELRHKALTLSMPGAPELAGINDRWSELGLEALTTEDTKVSGDVAGVAVSSRNDVAEGLNNTAAVGTSTQQEIQNKVLELSETLDTLEAFGEQPSGDVYTFVAKEIDEVTVAIDTLSLDEQQGGFSDLAKGLRARLQKIDGTNDTADDAKLSSSAPGSQPTRERLVARIDDLSQLLGKIEIGEASGEEIDSVVAKFTELNETFRALPEVDQPPFAQFIDDLTLRAERNGLL